MPRTIDPAKLMVAAGQLEWVLRQYPESVDVQALSHSLGPLIDAAKAGLITEFVEGREVPGSYNFADGLYVPSKDPDVEEAYVRFRVELRGGLTEQDEKRHAEMEAFRQSLLESRA